MCICGEAAGWGHLESKPDLGCFPLAFIHNNLHGLRLLPPGKTTDSTDETNTELALAKSAKVVKRRRIVDSLTLHILVYLSLMPFILPDPFSAILNLKQKLTLSYHLNG